MSDVRYDPAIVPTTHLFLIMAAALADRIILGWLGDDPLSFTLDSMRK